MPNWFKKKGKTATAAKPSAPSKKPFSVCSLLNKDLIVLLPDQYGDKLKAYEDLTRRLCEVRGLGDPAVLFNKVLEREQGPSTTLDTGLSIPHARVDQIKGMAAILGILQKPITDSAVSDLSIRAVFLFLSPSDPQFTAQHLQLLRSVSTLFQPEVVDQMAAGSSPEAVLQLLLQKEQSLK